MDEHPAPISSVPPALSPSWPPTSNTNPYFLLFIISCVSSYTFCEHVNLSCDSFLEVGGRDVR